MPLFRKLRPEEVVSASSLKPEERQILSDDALRFNTNVALLVAVLIGILACMVHCVGAAAGSWSYWSAVGTAATAFGAALGTGAVLGFLFGVPGPPKTTVNNITNAGPGTVALATGKDAVNAGGDIDSTTGKSGTQPQSAGAGLKNPPNQENGSAPPSSVKVVPPAQNPTPAARDSSISNLEQVADWVTKLLLGGGLTQMQRIPPKIWSWGRMVALGILGPAGGTEQAIVAHQAFSAGLLVYGFVLGFFAGFLITKLQLGKAIAADPVN